MTNDDPLGNASPRDNSFVGRERELRELYAGLRSLGSGRGLMFCLVGEPGIAKTRLADEVAMEAARLGYHIVWGRCWEGTGAPAFWPFIQVIRDCADKLHPTQLAALPRALRETIAPSLEDSSDSSDVSKDDAPILSLPARSGVV